MSEKLFVKKGDEFIEVIPYYEDGSGHLHGFDVINAEEWGNIDKKLNCKVVDEDFIKLYVEYVTIDDVIEEYSEW